jgi:hypothetical protein
LGDLFRNLLKSAVSRPYAHVAKPTFYETRQGIAVTEKVGYDGSLENFQDDERNSAAKHDLCRDLVKRKLSIPRTAVAAGTAHEKQRAKADLKTTAGQLAKNEGVCGAS